MIPNGIALKVTMHNGKTIEPVYEAHGWEKVSEIIKLTYNLEDVRDVEILNINLGGK